MYDVSILLPCRNEEDFIELCLESICAQKGLSEKSEIVVIDGMSDDRTRELVMEQQAVDRRIRLLDNPQKHVSAALNLGIRNAGNDIILRMDAHTEYASDYVKTCVETLEQTGADNVGGPARTRADGYMQEAIRFSYHEPLVVGGARFHDVDYEGAVDTVTYGCWRRSTLLDIGMFDEALVRNQDDELNFRIQRNGGTIWQSPKIKSWYWPRSTLGKVARQYFQYGYWKVYVIRKHRQPASIRHLVPGLFVAAVVASALLSLFWSPGFYALAIVTGVYALFVAATSIRISITAKTPIYLPVLPLTIMSFQLSYGVGFLVGWFDALVRGSTSASAKELSR